MNGTPSRPRRADLVEPAELARLGGLELVARQVVEGFVMGLHRSPHRGFSAEFAEHRAYQPGDDLRYLDWRMYGRSDRFYVKQFEEETNLRGYLLVDASASMDWSSSPELPTKFWYARHLAAALAMILIRQGDSVGLAVFEEKLAAFLEPRGGRRHWSEVIRTLERTEAAGGTEAAPALRDIAHRLRRRGLVVLLSDLLVDPETTRTALHYLRHRGHEVLVLHLMDPGERELAPGGETRFFDPESSDEIRVSVPDIRDEYRVAVEEAIEEWKRALVPHGIDHVVVDTSRPMTEALGAYLRKRERSGG